MQKFRLQSKQVFGVADTTKSGRATVKRLREAFGKVAPKIDKNLVTDALKSFGDD